jgi:hypothetical protein
MKKCNVTARVPWWWQPVVTGALRHLGPIRCDQGRRTGHLGHRRLARRGAHRVQGGNRLALQGWLGYHTMFFFADAACEALFGLPRRPGNACTSFTKTGVRASEQPPPS